MKNPSSIICKAALTLFLIGMSAWAQAPLLTILDPVDVTHEQVLPDFGDFLSKSIQSTGKFQILPRAAMEQKLAEFNWEAAKPCHEFQCGFDAGNILLSEYVCFGTISPLPGLYAYTFNILHVPTGQIIASEAGDVPRAATQPDDAPLKAKLSAFMAGLDPSRFDKSGKANRGLMAVMDLTSESPESRVLSERITTHVYASRHYDLMSRQELQELLTAMNIPPASLQTGDSGMIALGARLNVAYLVDSRLTQEGQGHRLDLALFDISGKRRIRNWPSKATEDFRDLLHLENRFFTTLTENPESLKPRGAVRSASVSRRSRWRSRLLSMVGVSTAAGLAAVAYSLHKDADGAHGRAEAAYSMESGEAWKRKAEAKDTGTLVYGSLAVLSLGASVTLLTF